jgi:hypothetical protein
MALYSFELLNQRNDDSLCFEVMLNQVPVPCLPLLPLLILEVGKRKGIGRGQNLSLVGPSALVNII